MEAGRVVVVWLKALAEVVEAVDLVVYGSHGELGVWVVLVVDCEGGVFTELLDVRGRDVCEAECCDIAQCGVHFVAGELTEDGGLEHSIVDEFGFQGEGITVQDWS